jgi:4-hydroxy-3-methylbut-2-enyl diphosphate reductase
MVQDVILVRPRGFCAGVERAVRVVEETLAICGAPVYVKHAIVHNHAVTNRLTALGAITVETVDQVPEGAVCVFSAHGSPPADYVRARERGVRVVDATCPLVTKVHLELIRYEREGYQIIYIGHPGHIEGLGVLAEATRSTVPLVGSVADVAALTLAPTDQMIYLTQTTLSVDETADIIAALQARYPTLTAPPLSDICYATTNRQQAIKELATVADTILVVGSTHSSNSKRLVEVALAAGVERSYLVDGVADLAALDFSHTTVLGISAGASAPEESIQEVVAHFTTLGATVRELSAVQEHMKFADPVELQKLRTTE